MKAVFILSLLLGVACIGVYYVGGTGNFDPTAQGKAAQAAITPGMTWEQVFDVTGDPKKYQIVNRKVERQGGEEFVYFKRTPPVKFKRERLVENLKNNTLPHGFVCPYNYSGSVAFSVVFDRTGTVTEIEDDMTMADLLQYKD